MVFDDDVVGEVGLLSPLAELEASLLELFVSVLSFVFVAELGMSTFLALDGLL